MNNINIDEWKQEVIKQTCELIKIPSVYEKSEDCSKPFGKNANDALEYMLKLGENLGFKTKNIDGYCGYIEFGEGKELLGIIGHLDVVPAGEGWKNAPFSATIEEGKIYGRGAIDDKGPMIACLYAMKAVKEQVAVNKRVRLIFGLNEEREWKCIQYYKEHEEWPTIGFSPDADFPCIFAEKGVLTIYFSEDYNVKGQENIIITDINCNSNPINVVPKFCEINLKINTEKINKNELVKYIENQITVNKFNIDIKTVDENIKLTSYGISSHSAHPELGKNAISMLLVLLENILKRYNEKIELLEKFEKLIGMQYDGKNLGINYKDESGTLTLNVGKCELTQNKLQIGINLRIPVSVKLGDIEEKIKLLISENTNIEMIVKGRKTPLYVSKENKLVKELTDTYNEVTGNKLEPVSIGGVTYARAFENCVSFGANMPGNEDMCHKVNEFISIDNLITACQIYAEAIYKLANK